MRKLFLLALMAAAFSANPDAEAKEKNVLNFQGTLRAENQTDVINKSMNMTFKIYDSKEGGVLLWEESNVVTVKDGFFNVYLGTKVDFDVNFAKELYIEITLDNNEKLPRTRLSASPFAFSAGIASSADTAEVAKSVIDGSLKWRNFNSEELAAGGVLSGTYPNPTMNYNKLLENIPQGSIDGNKIKGGVYPHIYATPHGVFQGDVAGSIFPDIKIKSGVLDTKHFKNNAVTSDLIAKDAVTTEKIRKDAVTSDKLADDAVLTAKIKDLQVTDKKLADGAVTSDKLADDAVLTAKIKDLQVTDKKLADGAVTSDKLADDAVLTAKIKDLQVTDKKLADGAVVEGKIADNAVLNNNIKAGAVTSDKISGEIANKGKVLQLDNNGKAVWNDIAGGLNKFDGTPTKEGQMFIFQNGQWKLTDGGVPEHNSVLKYSDISKQYTWQKDSGFELPYINDDAKSDPENEDLIRIKRTDKKTKKVMHLENSYSKGQNVLSVSGTGLSHGDGVVSITASSHASVANESRALNVTNFTSGETSKTTAAITATNNVWDVDVNDVAHKGVETKIESTINNGTEMSSKGSTIAFDGEAKGGNYTIGANLVANESNYAIGVKENINAKSDAWGTDATVTAERNATGTKEVISGQVDATGTDATITAKTGDGMGRKMVLTGQKKATGFENEVTAKTDDAFGSKMTLTADTKNATGNIETIKGNINATGTDATITATTGNGLGRKMVLTAEKDAIGFESEVAANTGDAFGSKIIVESGEESATGTQEEIKSNSSAYGRVSNIVSWSEDAYGTIEEIRGDIDATGTDVTITAVGGDGMGRMMVLTGQNTATGFESEVTAKTDDAFGSKMTLTADAKNAIGTTETITGQVDATGTDATITAKTGDAFGNKMTLTAEVKNAIGNTEVIKGKVKQLALMLLLLLKQATLLVTKIQSLLSEQMPQQLLQQQ